MRLLLFSFLLGALASKIAICTAQTITDDTQITGTWKGTSLCQVRSSPCNDEKAVYHINRSKPSNTYTITMNKMVNGTEVSMGDLEFIYDGTNKTLTCARNDRLKSVWKFLVGGRSIKGSLTINGNTLYRVISLNKE